MAILALAGICSSGCVPVNDQELAPEHVAKLDVQVRRAMEQMPDSVIGVLVQAREAPGPQERALLAEAGLSMGAVVGDVVSGRILARDIARLARLPFVVYIERARELELHRPSGTRESGPP